MCASPSLSFVLRASPLVVCVCVCVCVWRSTCRRMAWPKVACVSCLQDYRSCSEFPLGALELVSGLIQSVCFSSPYRRPSDLGIFIKFPLHELFPFPFILLRRRKVWIRRRASEEESLTGNFFIYEPSSKAASSIETSRCHADSLHTPGSISFIYIYAYLYVYICIYIRAVNRLKKIN